MFAVHLLILALYLVSWYKMFEKMGRQGWEGLIPIYNMVILLEVIKKPWWWVLLMLFIPIVNIVFMILAFIELSKRFGQGTAFAIGLTFLGFIFFPLLAFGDYHFTPDNNNYSQA